MEGKQVNETKDLIRGFENVSRLVDQLVGVLGKEKVNESLGKTNHSLVEDFYPAELPAFADHGDIILHEDFEAILGIKKPLQENKKPADYSQMKADAVAMIANIKSGKVDESEALQILTLMTEGLDKAVERVITESPELEESGETNGDDDSAQSSYEKLGLEPMMKKLAANPAQLIKKVADDDGDVEVKVMKVTHDSHKNMIGIHLYDPSEQEIDQAVNDAFRDGFEYVWVEYPAKMNNSVSEAKGSHKVGSKVKVNMGVDSGKTGVVVDKSAIKTNGRGTPEIEGHYKPMSTDDVAIKFDHNGKHAVYSKSHLTPVSDSKEEAISEAGKKGQKWHIIDWAGNSVFGGDTFDSFDDAEEFLSVKLGDDYETDRGEYDVVQGKTTDKKYLDPKDPRAGKKIKSEAEDEKVNVRELSPMVVQYLSTALWSSNDGSNEQGGDPLDDNYDISDIAEESVKKATEDCDSFYEKAEKILGKNGDEITAIESESLGHDFWLSRNGHGAGFFDADYLDEDMRDALQDLAKEFGEVNAYVADIGDEPGKIFIESFEADTEEDPLVEMARINKEALLNESKSEMVMKIKQMEADLHKAMHEKKISAPNGQEIPFKIMGHDEAETVKEKSGKVFDYPEMTHFNIESWETMKLSMTADGRIIPEGVALNGKGVPAEKIIADVLKNVKNWSAHVAKLKSEKATKKEAKQNEAKADDGAVEVAYDGTVDRGEGKEHVAVIRKGDKIIDRIHGKTKEAAISAAQEAAKTPKAESAPVTEMARQTTDVVAAAFVAGEPKKDKNNHTDGKSFFLHGNEIAKIEKGQLSITNAGWETTTTRERLNGIMVAAGVGKKVSQEKGKQMLDGKEWDGEWTKVGKVKPPTPPTPDKPVKEAVADPKSVKGKDMTPANKAEMGKSLPGKFVRSGDTDTAKKIMKHHESISENKGDGKPRIMTTYDIVTPESASRGDVAENGWEDEIGHDCTPDEHDIEDGKTVVDLAVEFLKDKGVLEPSSTQFHTGIWYNTIDPETDYQDGSEKNYAYHLYDFTPEQEKQVYGGVMGKKEAKNPETRSGDLTEKTGDGYTFTDKESQMESLAEYIDEHVTLETEYRTEHEDSGNDYLDAMMDSVNTEECLGMNMTNNVLWAPLEAAKDAGIPVKELDQILKDLVTAKASGVFYPDNAVSSTGQLGEVETQLDSMGGTVNGKKVDDVFEILSAGLDEKDKKAVARKLQEAYWDGKSNYAYGDAAYDTWMFVVDEDALIDAINEKLKETGKPELNLDGETEESTQVESVQKKLKESHSDSDLQGMSASALLKLIRSKEVTYAEVDKALEKEKDFRKLDWIGDQLAKDDLKKPGTPVDEASAEKNFEVWIKTPMPSTTEVDAKFATKAEAEAHMAERKAKNPDWKIWIETTSGRAKMSKAFPEAGETDDTGQTEAAPVDQELKSSVETSVDHKKWKAKHKAPVQKESLAVEIDGQKFGLTTEELNEEGIVADLAAAIGGSSEPEKLEELKTEIADSMDMDSGRYSSWGKSGSFEADGTEYQFIISEDEAEKIAKDIVTQDLEDDPYEMFSHDFLNEHLYVGDTDKRLIANDDADARMDGMSDEDIIDEVEMQDEYEAAEGKAKEKILDKAKEQIMSTHYDSVYEQLDKDPVGYFEDMGGAEMVKDMIEKNLLSVDVKAAAEEAVRIDGWAHFLSHYDGNYETTPGGVVYFKE